MVICRIPLRFSDLRLTREIIIVTFQVRVITAIGHNITGINPLPRFS